LLQLGGRMSAQTTRAPNQIKCESNKTFLTARIERRAHPNSLFFPMFSFLPLERDVSLGLHFVLMRAITLRPQLMERRGVAMTRIN
jgi:hypothetical protein